MNVWKLRMWKGMEHKFEFFKNCYYVINDFSFNSWILDFALCLCVSNLNWWDVFMWEFYVFEAKNWIMFLIISVCSLAHESIMKSIFTEIQFPWVLCRLLMRLSFKQWNSEISVRKINHVGLKIFYKIGLKQFVYLLALFLFFFILSSIPIISSLVTFIQCIIHLQHHRHHRHRYHQPNIKKLCVLKNW